MSQSHIYISFESVNFPGRFIRHRANHLFVEPKDSPNLAPDATFLPVLHMA
ncbi:AbfB domain-containing protein [Streptomyces sviceus]|uniref:AbfB domain-containing protein n=1 Tax=Streptomyces sviceus TaxID=285530 RepID=UPI0036A0B6BF